MIIPCVQSSMAKKFFSTVVFQIVRLIKNYTTRADRLRSLKGVNIGGYDGELCARKMRSIKSSVEPHLRVSSYFREYSRHVYSHSSAHALNATREMRVTDCRFIFTF